MTTGTFTARRLMQFVAAHVRQLGCTPTIRQISSGLGVYDREWVRTCVEALQVSGHIAAGPLDDGPIPVLTKNGEREAAAR